MKPNSTAGTQRTCKRPQSQHNNSTYLNKSNHLNSDLQRDGNEVVEKNDVSQQVVAKVGRRQVCVCFITKRGYSIYRNLYRNAKEETASPPQRIHKRYFKPIEVDSSLSVID